MPCYHPLDAYQCGDGTIVFAQLKVREHGGEVRQLSLPCGRCVGCRLERSRQWAVRCMHEAQLHRHNCFVTLTYDDEQAPGWGLHYPHFQVFMKRLRRRHPGVRFYMCGEYGEQFSRPHYHACFFNCHFRDQVYWRTSDSGNKLYRSGELESIWPFGFCEIGELTFQSAAYVARYCMEKITGQPAEDHYRGRSPEFNHMSLKPGIGADWLAKYQADVYPHDYVVINGKEAKPPRYYDQKLNSKDPLTFEEVQFRRETQARSRFEDNTQERLLVKEAVTKARLQFNSFRH